MKSKVLIKESCNSYLGQVLYIILILPVVDSSRLISRAAESKRPCLLFQRLPELNDPYFKEQSCIQLLPCYSS